MTVSDPSPIAASSTRITVSSGWNSRDVSLNGRLMGVTRSTPGSPAKLSIRAGLRLADLAHDRDHDMVDVLVVERRQTLSQDPALDSQDLGLAGAGGHHDEHRAVVSSLVEVGQTKKQRSGLCFVRPARPVPSVSVTEDVHAGHRK